MAAGRRPALSHGVEPERVACPLHEARPAKRLAPLCTRRREKPVHRSPRACHGGAEPVAASRSLDKPAMDDQEMRSGQTHATRARSRGQAVGLVVQATPVRAYGTTPPKQGMGTVQCKVRDESLLPAPVALPPERMTPGGRRDDDGAAAGAAGGAGASPQPQGSARALPVAARGSVGL